MNDPSPNLLNALFEFHPREGRTPKENFLSEAFAYVLNTCDEARDAWLSRVLGKPVRSIRFQVTTRQTERGESGSAIFPDMRMIGQNDGKQFDLYSEHKWNSPCNPGQLLEYLKIAKRRGNHCVLAFIGASYRQKRDAEQSDPKMKGMAFRWEDVFQVFDSVSNKPAILAEFLEFMKTHGLSTTRPIEPGTMLGFIQSRGFLTTLEHFANRLNNDFDWDFVPNRYRSAETRAVSNRWGRAAIEFATPGSKPTITIGFLFDEADHRVSFVDRHKGIDLLLRIETPPVNQTNIGPALVELRIKRDKLEPIASSALVLRDPGNGNPHSLLIVRSCLGDVIANAETAQEQLEVVYHTLKKWLQVLFDDGRLEESFRDAGLDSGM